MARRDRLEQILDAAAKVLGERGWYGATLRDVARRAGVGLATVYHYVASKDDLLYQVERRILDAAETSALAALAGRGARERLRALLTDHVRRVQARPVEATVLGGGIGVLRGERGRRLGEGRARYVATVSAAIDAALRAGATRGRESEERAGMLLAMADRLALEALREGRTPAPGRLATRALGVFLEGAHPGKRTGRPRRR